MFSTIWNKIYAILNWMWKFKAVYNYERKIDSEWFPVATITPITTPERIYDNVANQANVNYSVKMFQQNKDIATTEANIRTLVDLVLAELRADYTLTGSAVSMNMTIDWLYTADEQPIRVVEIKLNYIVLIDYI